MQMAKTARPWHAWMTPAAFFISVLTDPQRAA